MKLSNENIGETVDEIVEFFRESKVSKKDLQKIGLLVEEVLLRYQEKFGEEQEFTLKSNKWFGAPKITIKLTGENYDPLLNPQNDFEVLFEKVMNKLLNYETAGIVYEYKYGSNEITIFSTKEKRLPRIPGGSITTAILLAVICSLIIKQFPQDIQIFFGKNIFNPLSDGLMNMITAMTVPMIFISVVSGICLLDDIAILSKLGIRVIKRFTIIMTFITFVTITVCEIFFPVVTMGGATIML